MKKTGLVVLAVIVSVASYGQSKAIEAFYNKYKNDRDASVVTLNSSIFELFSSIAELADDEDAAVLARIADGIDAVNILSLPLYSAGISMEETANLRKDIKKEGYEELITVRDGKEQMYFFAQTGNKKIKNMLVLINDGDDDFTVMNLDGTLDMKDIAYLAEHRDRWGK